MTAFTLLPAATLAQAPRRSGGGRRADWLAGALIAILGYPLGRIVLADTTMSSPTDSLRSDLFGLGLLSLTEELIWGRQVEPAIGCLVTAGFFALKHPLIDGRWRRVLGLGLFWLGLAHARRQSPRAALALHLAANALGVLVGHAVGEDQF